jgi:hypothetical protein
VLAGSASRTGIGTNVEIILLSVIFKALFPS